MRCESSFTSQTFRAFMVGSTPSAGSVSSNGVHIGVLLVKWVASLAGPLVSALSTARPHAIASAEILLRGYRLKVVRVAASAVAAQVIDLQVIRDRTSGNDVRDLVCAGHSPLNANDSVAVFTSMFSPVPAPR
jgi:hypothetical protein